MFLLRALSVMIGFVLVLFVGTMWLTWYAPQTGLTIVLEAIIRAARLEHATAGQVFPIAIGLGLAFIGLGLYRQPPDEEICIDDLPYDPIDGERPVNAPDLESDDETEESEDPEDESDEDNESDDDVR